MPQHPDEFDPDELPDPSDQSNLEGADTVPCPKCGKPVMVGSVCCAACGQYMPWDEDPPVSWVTKITIIIAVLLLIGLLWAAIQGH